MDIKNKQACSAIGKSPGCGYAVEAHTLLLGTNTRFKFNPVYYNSFTNNLNSCYTYRINTEVLTAAVHLSTAKGLYIPTTTKKSTNE